MKCNSDPAIFKYRNLIDASLTPAPHKQLNLRIKSSTMNSKFLAIIVVLCSFHTLTTAQPFESKYLAGMQWRCIGPHRGGRTIGAVGVPSLPNVFYIGVNNGGVWKTNDYGRTWNPIFDEQPTGSVGDVVVSASNPLVLYAGCGEGVQRPDLSVGDGVYRSADGGKTWTNTGLKDGLQIGGLAIDPKNENRVFAAVLGHPYGANSERGVYRTTNGGTTWERVLYKDENTGAVQVAIDPNNPDIIYADLWANRLAPWENGEWNGTESGLFKSTDGGNTWKKLVKGLPTTQQGLGRIGFCIAPSNSNRLYATVDAGKYGGIYRSDDAGESWTNINADDRLWGRGSDFAEVKADPKNADIVYTAAVVVWKSIDGGKTWKGIRGAPGGDDYHRIWINPNDPNIILIASDQGAIITVNGGESFSSWYNQPTAQFYHVSADNAFPYNVYSGQQESGSVGIASRGNDGQINFRDWHPVAAEEYGYVVADPLDPNIIYGGKLSKYDKRNGQSQHIAPEVVRSGKYRFIRTAPVLFSPIDKRTLFYAGNVLFKTTTGGSNWQIISPDLTRTQDDISAHIPGNIGIYKSEEIKKMPRRGVIYTVAPSYVDSNTIWCGTDDGLIQVTHDGGKNWNNVTPPGITPWSKVSLMDASHSDVNTAYAAVNRIRLDDLHPHIYRTADGGKTWTEIVNGLPDEPVNTVKEDPERKGLLFAGTEHAVYVSFDNGGHWQSLRLNMPATSIRDLVIKDDDIVVATHGRSFWILDDITPLRQLNNQLTGFPAILFAPQRAYRVRWSMNSDTPIPQEEPAGQNPPEGALINYYLDRKATDISLEILDAGGSLIRKYSNKDTLYKVPDVNIPLYWIRPQQVLSAESGAHRFLWDMHYTPLNVPASYPMAAIYMNTAPAETSPWVVPGKYHVRLTVDGKAYNQDVEVVPDPRVKTSQADLQTINSLAYLAYDGRKRCMDAMGKIARLHEQVQAMLPRAKAQLATRLNKLDSALLGLQHSGRGGSEPDFSTIDRDFSGVFNIVNSSDLPPTSQAKEAAIRIKFQLEVVLINWLMLNQNDIKQLNSDLAKAGLPELKP